MYELMNESSACMHISYTIYIHAYLQVVCMGVLKHTNMDLCYIQASHLVLPFQEVLWGLSDREFLLAHVLQALLEHPKVIQRTVTIETEVIADAVDTIIGK